MCPFGGFYAGASQCLLLTGPTKQASPCGGKSKHHPFGRFGHDLPFVLIDDDAGVAGMQDIHMVAMPFQKAFHLPHLSNGLSGGWLEP